MTWADARSLHVSCSVAPAFVFGENHQLGLESLADLDNTSTWGWFVKAILDKKTVEPFLVNVSYVFLFSGTCLPPWLANR